MKLSKLLSDKGTNLRKLKHKKHVSLETIHSTEEAFELRHLHVFRKLETESKEVTLFRFETSLLYFILLLVNRLIVY